MVAPGIASHRATSHLQASSWNRHHNGDWGTLALRLCRAGAPNWRCQQADIGSGSVSSAANWHGSTSHHGHRGIHFHLATAVRASSAARDHAHAHAQAQAICWRAWLQFGHGCTGSRSCAISNWNLSFMWPEARVVSAARGHCLARTSTSTRTRNWLYLGLFPFLCLFSCLSPVFGLFIFLCLHCQQSINLRIMRVLKCNGNLSYSPKKCNQILCTALC